MKNIQESVLKALSGVLPEEVVGKVSDVITNTLEEATKEIEAEYQERLDESHEEFKKELAKAQQEAEHGYSQAFELIAEYKDKMELLKEEHKREINSGFGEAYEMLEQERAKNVELEGDLQREYDEKLQDIEKYYGKKLDEFLPTQGKKFYEMARKDLLNDPVFAEHKNAFEKILEAAATVLTDNDFALAGNAKTETVLKENEELKKKVQRLEGNSTRLKMDNEKLTEAVRVAKTQILTEAKVEKKEERKNRIEKAKNVEGRGKVELNEERQVILGEPVADRSKSSGQELNEEREASAYWTKMMTGIDEDSE